MVSYDRILVPVDGSDGSGRALDHALAIASATGATVDLLHVLDTAGGLGTVGAYLDPEVIRDRGETILETAERSGEAAGVDVTTELRPGRPAETIVAYAQEHDAGLVVMSRRGARRAGQGILGGVTDKVLRAGERPVLVVPPGDRQDPDSLQYARVLLPTDGSECAAIATDHGAYLADRFGAEIHVVTAMDVQAAGGLFDAGGVSAEFVEALEGRAEEAIDDAVDRLSETVEGRIERAVVRGAPVEALREYVDDHDVDLIAMGAHGRTGFRRWVLGSVTDRLLRTVDVPVLVVPWRE